MAHITTNGIDIAYETYGEPWDRPLVLIMGLATSKAGWPEPFCRILARTGHRVICFDNRDVGRSSKLDDLGAPDMDTVMRSLRGERTMEAPYSLEDMAADTVGLLDALDIEKAHICGMSMGGMIAQIMALAHPHRVCSLISMMSTTGERDLPPSTPEAQVAMMSMPPDRRQAYQDYLVEIGRVFSGGSPYYDPEVQRELAGRAFDQEHFPPGTVRQLIAMMTSPGRREALRSITTPTLVMHGTHDPVVLPQHGRDTAKAIPGATLLMLDGLGHGLAYPSLWEAMTFAIMRHTAAVQDGF